MRQFIVSDGSATVTGSTTLVFLNPIAAPSVNIAMLRLWAGQSGSTTSAQQRIKLVSQVVGFPTGMTAATVAKVKRHDPAVSVLIGSTTGVAGTAGTNATGEGTGAQTHMLDDAFNVLNGWLHVPTPSEVIVFPAGSTSGFGMKFPTTPSSLTNWSFGVTYEER
jgi:hypothetical protein